MVTELFLISDLDSVLFGVIIPDEARLPESSESNPCFFFLLSEHRPACRFPSSPQSVKIK